MTLDPDPTSPQPPLPPPLLAKNLVSANGWVGIFLPVLCSMGLAAKKVTELLLLASTRHKPAVLNKIFDTTQCVRSGNGRPSSLRSKLFTGTGRLTEFNPLQPKMYIANAYE